MGIRVMKLLVQADEDLDERLEQNVASLTAKIETIAKGRQGIRLVESAFVACGCYPRFEKRLKFMMRELSKQEDFARRALANAKSERLSFTLKTGLYASELRDARPANDDAAPTSTASPVSNEATTPESSTTTDTTTPAVTANSSTTEVATGETTDDGPVHSKTDVAVGGEATVAVNGEAAETANDAADTIDNAADDDAGKETKTWEC
jgi:hypothetical protein